MDKMQKEIQKFIEKHPEIAKAMDLFRMSMDEYQKAYRFLIEPKTTTTNTTNPPEDIEET